MEEKTPAQKTKEIKRKSKKQEAETAKVFDGRVQPASGALAGEKGDVKTEKYLIENKYTDSLKYPLKQSILAKIREEAVKKGRIPLLELSFPKDDNIYIVFQLNDSFDIFTKEIDFLKNYPIRATMNTTSNQVTLNKTLLPQEDEITYVVMTNEYIIVRREDFLKYEQEFAKISS